jgi:hypothetical protein
MTPLTTTSPANHDLLSRAKTLKAIAAKDPQTAQLINKARVTELIRDEKGDVVGCKYVKNGVTYEEMGPVIIASGGFGADFSETSLLAGVASDWRKLNAWKDFPQAQLPNLRDLCGAHFQTEFCTRGCNCIPRLKQTCV